LNGGYDRHFPPAKKTSMHLFPLPRIRNRDD
jgi:hypothetical protein